jgi:hypothetical protein
MVNEHRIDKKVELKPGVGGVISSEQALTVKKDATAR